MTGIYAQRYDAGGSAQGTEFRVPTTYQASDYNPRVGMDTAGNFVIAWAATNTNSTSWVRAQRYNADGKTQGNELTIYDSNKGTIGLAMNRQGGFIVVLGKTDGSGPGIFAQEYNVQGIQLGSALVNNHTSGWQEHPTVATDTAGNAVIVWDRDGPNDPYGIFGRRFLNAQARVPTGQLTAYRPQTQFVPKDVPVSESEEATMGAGVRMNNDDDDRDGFADRVDAQPRGENDLIKVTVRTDTLTPGYQFVLSRSNPNIRVWRNSEKLSPVLAANNETVLPPAGTFTFWVEYFGLTHGTSLLQLSARQLFTGNQAALDTVKFYSFRSIVIALGGEWQSLPKDIAAGTYQTAIELFKKGYDVHMYDEDDVTALGWGPAYAEVVRAVRERKVSNVAIFGFSHGGGSVYDLANRLNINRARIGFFTTVFTGYIDAITTLDRIAERRLPPGTRFHVNLFETKTLLLHGNTTYVGKTPAYQLNVTITSWGRKLGHSEIDDDPLVRNLLRASLITRVTMR